MPELPEVEIVCRHLSEKLFSQKHNEPLKLTQIKTWRKNLRYEIPKREIQRLIRLTEGNELLEIKRRAKFIQFEFKNTVLISHLGMTGRWSFYRGDIKNYDVQKHDHLALCFLSNVWLIYNDPRRFGFVELINKQDLPDYFENYGFEPLSMRHHDEVSLWEMISHLNSPIKSIIMNQKYLVGVGNIYACEALFKEKIDPFKLPKKIKKETFFKLLSQIKKILSDAILAGGSSIKNYRHVDLSEGNFQKMHLVYGRENQPCRICKNQVRRKILAGRSTFYCSACQD